MTTKRTVKLRTDEFVRVENKAAGTNWASCNTKMTTPRYTFHNGVNKHISGWVLPMFTFTNMALQAVGDFAQYTTKDIIDAAAVAVQTQLQSRRIHKARGKTMTIHRVTKFNKPCDQHQGQF